MLVFVRNTQNETLAKPLHLIKRRSSGLAKVYNLNESLGYSSEGTVYKSSCLCSSEFGVSFYSLAGVSQKKESLWSNESVVMFSLSSPMTGYSFGVFFRGVLCGFWKKYKLSGLCRRSLEKFPKASTFSLGMGFEEQVDKLF